MRSANALLFALVVLLGPTASLAQTHVVFTGFGTQPQSVSDFDLQTESANWQMPQLFPFANWIISRAPAITGDGRFAIWRAINPQFVGGIVVRDLLTGELSGAPLPLLEFSLDSANVVLAHPHRLTVYALLAGGGILIAEPSGHRLAKGCPRPIDAAITLDGARLFIACEDRILVFDTSTESVVHEIAQKFAIRLEVNHDGSRLASITSRMNVWGLTLHDANTGELIALEEVNAPRVLGLHSNALRTEFYASFVVGPSPLTSHETRVYSFETLARIATIPAGFHSLAFGAEGTFAIGVSPAGNGFIDTGLCHVVFLDEATHSLRPPSYVAYCEGLFTNVALVEPPLTPKDVTVNVSNQRVTFDCQLELQSPAANAYALDVALQPGGPVLTTLQRASEGTSFFVDDVPSGTYYVRLRAINAVGSSVPSVELEVVVP